MGRPDTDVVEWTDAYEGWLGRRIPLVRSDLSDKHREMAGSALRFLRGSYYLWIVRLGSVAADVLDGPVVPIVGDLHVENFGTWRDSRGVRRWGVNDLDESGRGAYGIDLVRLATSAMLAPHIGLPDRIVCATLFDRWSTAQPGTALELDDESAHHLRPLLPEPEPPGAFYARLATGPRVDPSEVPAAIRERVLQTGPHGWVPTWHARSAGTGSLGRPRFEAVADQGGAPYACEVKLLAGSAASWARSALGAPEPVPSGMPSDDERVFEAAQARLPGPDPAGRVDAWQYRRRSPDDVRIELSHLGEHASERLLRSMGEAVADIHGLDPDALAAARAHAADRPDGWLRDAAGRMCDDVRAAHRTFAAAQPSRAP